MGALANATLGAGNARGWKRLFVQGVGHYLQAWSSGHAQIGRERAAEPDGFMADTNSGVGRFMTRMAAAIPNGVVPARRGVRS